LPSLRRVFLGVSFPLAARAASIPAPFTPIMLAAAAQPARQSGQWLTGPAGEALHRHLACRRGML